MTTVTQADRACLHAMNIPASADDLLIVAAHREAAEARAFEAGAKAMSAKDVAAICCAWLDADDATHWGAFEKALDAVVRPLDPAQIAGDEK